MALPTLAEGRLRREGRGRVDYGNDVVIDALKPKCYALSRRIMPRTMIALSPCIMHRTITTLPFGPTPQPQTDVILSV